MRRKVLIGHSIRSMDRNRKLLGTVVLLVFLISVSLFSWVTLSIFDWGDESNKSQELVSAGTDWKKLNLTYRFGKCSSAYVVPRGYADSANIIYIVYNGATNTTYILDPNGTIISIEDDT